MLAVIEELKRQIAVGRVMIADGRCVWSGGLIGSLIALSNVASFECKWIIAGVSFMAAGPYNIATRLGRFNAYEHQTTAIRNVTVHTVTLAPLIRSILK